MQNNSTHIVIISLLTLITLNLFILDLKIFSPSNNIKISDITSIATPIPSPTINPSTSLGTGNQQLTINNYQCPLSCLTLIQQATESSRTGSSFQPTTYNSQPTTIREFYIPLGSGSTTKSDWDDITATETLIDPANYGRIKEAYFIASLRNPTQNGMVEAQLYNVTDKHIVWDSHVQMNGPVSQTITSNKITLDGGAKLYRVQLRSTLQFAALLENAKVRIVTE